MLKIRLSRIGKKNRPSYRLIISESSRDTFGEALEILGSYNPHSKDLQVKADRVKYWLSKGAQMSSTVNNLLVGNKVIEKEIIKTTKNGVSKKNKGKTEEAAPTPKAEAAAPKVEETAEVK